MAVRVASDLRKPELDRRSYRVIRLSNELEVLLIHDGETDMAGSSMDVSVGTLQDPADMLGMAHAVEHMLFMGTKKYPRENEYQQYLAKFGGSSNANTTECNTNYFFEIGARAEVARESSKAEPKGDDKVASPLYGALDRFAQFFIAPLFLEDTIERELQSIDTEYCRSLQDDEWRLAQLDRHFVNKDHNAHRSFIGNLKTLRNDPLARGVNIRNKFVSFYKQQYSANRMKLVVLGKEALDELEDWVVELFGGIPNYNYPHINWKDTPAYTSEGLSTLVLARPVLKITRLYMTFLYRDEGDLWRTRPACYLSYLLGHEGPGSILAYTKARGWTEALDFFNYTICPGTGFLEFAIELTDVGLEHYEEVVKAIFQYIAMMKKEGPQSWIMEEVRHLAEVEFRFKESMPVNEAPRKLAKAMQFYKVPRENLLSARYMVEEIDLQAIEQALTYLTPGNFRLTLVSQKFEGDRKEPWYGTEYSTKQMSSSFLNTLEGISATDTELPTGLHLPAKNEFIPDRLEVIHESKHGPMITPMLIRNNTIRTWWKQDDQFRVPRTNVNIILSPQIAMVSVPAVVRTFLFAELVKDSLVEYGYSANLAGSEYHISDHDAGLEIKVGGYSDKLHVLLEKVMKAVAHPDFKRNRFDAVKSRARHKLMNLQWEQPIDSYCEWFLNPENLMTIDRIEELHFVTFEDIRDFSRDFLPNVTIEMLVNGNLTNHEALEMTDIVETCLSPMRREDTPDPIRPPSRSCLLTPGISYVWDRLLLDRDAVNHIVDYQILVEAGTDHHKRAQVLLIARMIEEPFHHTLRTKEQLGYLAAAEFVEHKMLAGMRMLIQGPAIRTTQAIESRMDAFLLSFGTALRDLREEELQHHRAAFINERLRGPKTLNDETKRLWSHITSGSLDFETASRDVECIREVTKHDLLGFFERYISPLSKQRSKLSIHLIAQKSPEGTVWAGNEIDPESYPSDNVEYVGNLVEFKLNQKLSKAMQPVKPLSAFEWPCTSRKNG